jgi:uncharacterized protein YgbK (DUF1537 family)
MIGVVADDITGAGDIGIMYAKSGLAAHVYSFTDPAQSLPRLPMADAVILDTNSRFDEPEKAYAKVYEATMRLKQEGAARFINKTCSVFRGNIGSEFDAMLDALQEEFAVVVLGFPKNGRTTINGIHYVHGKKLEESEFRNDPVHPMHRSDLVGILQAQTNRKVGAIDHFVVEQGPEALQSAIDKLRNQVQYVILDVVDQSSLQIIAKAAQNERILCGSSALAEELAALQADDRRSSQPVDLPPMKSELGIFIAAGSLMPQTSAQIDYLREKGVPVLELDTLQLVSDSKKRESALDQISDQVIEILRTGSDVLLHSTNTAEGVQQTKQAGEKLGLSNSEVSRLVSSALAEITASVLAETGQNRIIIAGGDTSAAVCERLNITGMRVYKEIQAGLPSCLTLSEPNLLLVLKSGSFGAPKFFEQALIHLREE